MAAAARSSAGLVVAALVLAGVGCEPREREARTGIEARGEGHVYLAQLIALHPLYADLARIEATVRALRQPERPLQVPDLALGGQLAGVYVTGPVLLSWPGATWEARSRSLQRTSQPGAGDADRPLPPDLAARLHGRTLQAQRSAREALRQAEAEASQQLAQEANRLYGENLERLSAGDADREAAQARDELRQGLETRLELLRRRQRGKLLELAEREAARAQEVVHAEEEEVRRRALDRLVPTSDTGRRLREEAVAAMGPLELPGWIGEISAPLPAVELPAHSESAGPAQALRQQAREATADALARRQSELTNMLLRAARLAAEKAGRDRRLRVHCVPGDQPVGPDITDQVAEDVRRLWQYHSR